MPVGASEPTHRAYSFSTWNDGLDLIEGLMISGYRDSQRSLLTIYLLFDLHHGTGDEFFIVVSMEVLSLRSFSQHSINTAKHYLWSTVSLPLPPRTHAFMPISRIQREKMTLTAMVRIYCNAHHEAGPNCKECEELVGYAHVRLDKCPFQEDKPTCSKCTVHCYRPEMRDKVRSVMRFSGPRMIVQHPVMAVRHLMDGTRKPHAREGTQ